MARTAFIDLEASGLGPASWPIEVGWCFVDSGPEAMLIAPVDEWSLDAWDPNAQALHGVSVDELHASGHPAVDACRRLNDALEGAQVYSDAPDWDAFWIYRLFSAAGEKQRFALQDFGALLSGRTRAEISEIVRRAADIAPHSHRACADVLHMKAIYEIIRAE
ncbi:MAG: hypothetical protein ACX939_12490 [Hyphococcus sp.]